MNPMHDFSTIFRWHQAGQLTLALDAYLALLREQPHHVEALVALATLYLQLGQLSASAERYEMALMLQPEHVLALHNYGKCLQKLQRREEALRQFDRCIRQMPQYENAYVSKARLLLEMGVRDGHLEFLRTAVQQFPKSADLRLQLALYCRRYATPAHRQEALEAIAQALRMRPDSAVLHTTHGNLLTDMQAFDAAIEAFLAAINADSRYAKAHFNLGLAYFHSGRYEASVQAYQTALALDPHLPSLRNNLANAFQNLHRFDEALALYEQTLALDPDDAIARANQGMLLLLLGRFEEGWRSYEARLRVATLTIHAGLLNFPRWDGNASLQGKTIVLHPEQGLGDTLQFCRYAALLAREAEQVILCVNLPLLRLLQTSVANWEWGERIQVITAGAHIPTFHYQISLLNLPAVLDTRLDSIPCPGTYIFTDPSWRLKWQSPADSRAKKRIGLVWSGSAAHTNDHHRSIALSELWSHLSEIDRDGFEFHSLQKELKENEQTILRELPIVDHRDELNDFSDTAALIETMDLVLSVDTSVAHLSAAMGKTTWILLPFVPDFRWLLDREDSPWYHSVRLFRQSEARVWTGALQKASTALSAMGGSTAASLSNKVDVLDQLSSRVDASAELSASLNKVVATSSPSPMAAANALSESGQWLEAEQRYREICAAQGSSAILHNNWGVVLQKLRRFDEALTSFDLAMRLDADYVSPRINKAMCLLSLNQFEEGWRLYEWRWKNEQWANSRRVLQAKLWLGEEAIAGRGILVYAEQGLGDSLQFCRLLFLLKEQGAEITFEVPASLIDLLQTLPVTLRVLGETAEDSDEFEFQCPLLSLPAALKLAPSQLPIRMPYLTPSALRSAKWATRIPSSTRPRVGVVWAGAAAHRNDAQRSIGLNLFSSLLMEKAEFYVLQKVLSRAEKTHLEVMRSFGQSIHILADELHDFSDTAAAIAQLDLVITVDTSVAHLAGALGKPVWICLAYEADFRWLVSGDTSAWYPSARLFRQQQVGQWKPVLEEVKQALRHGHKLVTNG